MMRRLTLFAAVTALAAGAVGGEPETAPAQAPAAKSLLPDSFDGPTTAPVTPAAPLLPAEADPAAPAAPQLLPQLQPGGPDAAFTTAAGGDLALQGPLTPAAGGYGAQVFAGSDGRFLAGLSRRIAAPIGSRWAAITLRRALLSQSGTPDGIVPGDWIAARAGLLVRLGEIDGAKRLVDGLPVDRYTPALYRVAAQTALAAADIGGLCPIAVTGQSLSADAIWKLAIGMCAAIEGDDITAARVFDALRNDSAHVDPFDVRLGERVATMAGGAGRATNIDWAEAPVLTPFRYGIATAVGVAIPPEKLAALGPARFGWLVRSPGVPADVRLAALRPAAVAGTVSAEELVSGITALSPANAGSDSAAGRLRTAFAGTSSADRRAALQAIWASGGDDRYGALIESAGAAARLPISADSAADSADIIAALLSAGMTEPARRWWPVADKAGGAVRARAWGLLAAAGIITPTPQGFKDWRSDAKVDDRHAALLLAALAGLGRAEGSQWQGLRDGLLPKAANSWTRAIDAAAAAGHQGEAIILAGTGLQGAWADVPPLHLYHIVAALTRAGRPAEARLIAAEAQTRA